MQWFWLLAKAGAPGRRPFHQEFGEFVQSSWPWLVGLVVALGLLTWAVSWLRAKLYDNTDTAVSGGLLLDEYREMLRQGELTEEEFRLIKSRLGGRASRMVPPGVPGSESPPDERVR